MKKVDKDFVLNSYKKGIEKYQKAAIELGLWESEKHVIEKYFDKQGFILDMGCGAGRTSLGMEKLGFNHIRAFDLNPEMIQAARQIATDQQSSIQFGIGDATQLDFSSEEFDHALFSFNGIMTIPGSENRQKAFGEAWRILKPGGTFIFTAHDREKDPKYFDFWQKETEKWSKGEMDERLYEFGDIFTPSGDVEGDIYIHIPNADEVKQHLTDAGFELLESFFRKDKFDESPEIKAFSGECEFWVVRKA